MTAAGLHAELEAALLQLGVLLPDDKVEWDGNQLLRLAVERLWVIVGTTAQEYRKAAGIDAGVEPWAELCDFRSVLAHMTFGEVNHDRVWHESVRDLPRLLEQVQRSRP